MNGTVIIFCALSFVCRAQLQADSLGVPYSAQFIKMLSGKVACSQHFSEADFTSPECIGLNRMVVPNFCATSSDLHSAPKTYITYFLYPSYEFLVTSCCLYKLPSCPETNQNIFQLVHNGIQNIFK